MNKSRRMRYAAHVARMGRGMDIEFCWESQKEKRPLGIHTRRWEDNVKMDLREIGWGGMDWIDLASGYGPMEDTVINLRIP
jgi:hypothetical protein